jgi:O-6-methylguanine DNA methyltransferase
MTKKEGASFRERVFAVVRKIPKGKTMTYKEVAWAAGSSGAYRAVGNILSTNFDPDIPCHRVIRSDGKLGGYNRGLGKKEAILVHEKNHG